MIISFGLWGALPAAFSPNLFGKDIPGWLVLSENIFRILAFSLPVILYFGKKEKGQTLGWYLYFVGLIIYLLTYLMQIFFPAGAWSQSAIGFTAGAWSTFFWLAGVGLVCVQSWLPIRWYRPIYLGCALIFLVFHTGHALLVYNNLFR